MPIDKILHIIAGFFAYIFFFLVLGVPIGYSLLAVLIIGILKEVRDKVSGKGTPELLDIVATVAGGICGAIIIGVIK